MTSLKGLPPLPKSFDDFLGKKSKDLNDSDKIEALKGVVMANDKICNGKTLKSDLNGHYTNGSEVRLKNWEATPRKQMPPRLGLNGTIEFLKKEMASLRQLDMTLLCQLWTLNDSIQEYKQMIIERQYDTHLEADSFSLENSLNKFPITEENESIYENVDCYYEKIKPNKLPEEEDVYLEPVPRQCDDDTPIPIRTSKSFISRFRRLSAGNRGTSYESAC